MNKNDIEIRMTEIQAVLENGLYESKNEEKELLKELQALEKSRNNKEEIIIRSVRKTPVRHFARGYHFSE